MFVMSGVLYKLWPLLYGREQIHLFILLIIVNGDFLNSSAFEWKQLLLIRGENVYTPISCL